MRLGLRARIFLASAVGIVPIATAGYLLLSSRIDGALREGLDDDATARLSLAMAALPAGPPPVGPNEQWDAWADDVGSRCHCRVTVFDANAVASGDSTLAMAELHARGQPTVSPEVVNALQGRDAIQSRYSTTSSEPLSFAAAPIRRNGDVVGVVRVGLSTVRIEEAHASAMRVALLICGVGVLVAGIVSAIVARMASTGVRRLTFTARRMAGGDLETRTREDGEDDLADLGRSLDQLADGLRSSLKELVHERDLLSGLIVSMREGVLLVDRDGKVALVNPALREMLLIGDEPIGKLPIEIVRDSALHDLLDSARRRREAAFGEIDVTGLKPRRLMVRAELLPVEPGGLLVVFYDVTNLRRLETLRRDFVANASHELRTPVTAIRSAAETLLDVPPSDRTATERFIAIISRNAGRLQQLVEDLLDLSKIESRELKLSARAIDTRAAVQRVTGLLAERAQDANIKFVVEIHDDHPRARADARALEQVLLNLLDNAIKYCPAATVTIRATADDARVAVVVADSGPGILARHLDRLFERFYRVDAGRSRQLGGTGLGLAIVKHLVEAMGGEVSVESEVGKGTTFTLDLPRAELELAELAAPKEEDLTTERRDAL